MMKNINKFDVDDYFKEIAKNALCNDYKGVIDFFSDLLSDSLKMSNSDEAYFYFVLLTRRCNVLFSTIVYEIILPDWDKNRSDCDVKEIKKCINEHFMTDNAFLNNAKTIAEIYQQQNQFPHIIIVDELLIHGRALNNLLTMFENSFAYYTGENVLYSLAMKNMISEHLEIRVYAKNNERTLLHTRYARKLIVKKDYNVFQWRQLSQRFGVVVSSSCHNNVSCSFEINAEDEAAKKLNKIFSTIQFDEKYEKICTKLYRKKISNIICGYPSIIKPKIIFDLRWKCNVYSKDDNKYRFMMVPYIIHGNINLDNAVSMHNKIMENIPSKCRILFDYSQFYDFDKMVKLLDNKLFYEINDLFLSLLFLKQLLSTFPEGFRRYICLDEIVDVQAIVRYWFKVVCDYNEKKYSKYTELKDAILELLRWEPTEEFIEECLSLYTEDNDEDDDFLWDSSIGTLSDKEIYSNENIIKILNAVREKIYEFGIESEKVAFYNAHGFIDIPELSWKQWGYKPTGIKNAIEEILEQLGCGKDIRIIKIILAFLIHEMDEGAISMMPVNPLSSNPEDYDEINYNKTGKIILKAGEQALFIKPQRYMLYMPLLIAIVNYCQGNMQDIKTRLEDFLKKIDINYESTSKELYYFLEQLNESKQDIKDWNFELSRNIDTYDVDNMSNIIKVYDAKKETLEIANAANMLMLQFLASE